MPKPRFALIRHGGYAFDVLFAIGASDNQVRAKLQKLGEDPSELPDMPETARGHTDMLSGGQTIIRLREFKREPSDWALLSHEVWHAVSFLFRRIGISLTVESDEAFGYAIQDLTEKAAEKLRLTAR